MNRQIVLDTETTGLEVSQGHRIIEIGATEIINRRCTQREFHYYLQPDREIDEAAAAVHGIRADFLVDKPRFATIATEFIDFIRGAEVLIHNAAFDVGFLNYELSLLPTPGGSISDYCTITDTLALARAQHPGQRNSLDALCKRYAINSSKRNLHGALLDAQLLAEVYLAMTGGQVSLLLEDATLSPSAAAEANDLAVLPQQRPALPVILANLSEQEQHQLYLQYLQKTANGACLWLQNPA